MPAMVTVMAATSLAVLRTGLFARWTGWLGMVFAIGGLVGTAGITLAWTPLADVWFVGIFGWWLWALVVAITCGRRYRRTGAGARSSRSPTTASVEAAAHPIGP